MTIINKHINGLFKGDSIAETNITSDCDVILSLSQSKDPIFLLLDLTETPVGAFITFNKGETITLDAGGMGIVPITTYGIAEAGKISFSVKGKDAPISGDMKIKLYSFSHINVINH